MATLNESMIEYRKQLERGMIKVAYKGLMAYFMDLRMHFKNKFPEYVVSSNIYYGYMDMTYFSCFPKSLKSRNLKFAIVFLHQSFQFEVWLAGYNKQIQIKYWNLIRESGWNEYHLVSTTKGADSILEHVLVDNPDFDDLGTLTAQIETGTLKFIEDVENFLRHLKM